LRNAGWRDTGLVAALVCAAALAAACGSPASSRSPGILSASAGGNPFALLATARTGFGTVLTNGTGYTLYWFSKDTVTSSACGDVCMSSWPPVTGTPRPAGRVSVPGTLGTIIRSDGVLQATYDGHPLYTYAGDFEPGDVGGNGVAEFGGLWYVVRPG
jgi:predicted lipoprotein with Yx(FWY)xxD motif